MTVTVVGLGKIGLPLAVQYARMGNSVFGSDINQDIVDLVNRGIEPFPGEINLREFLEDVVSRGKLKASVDTRACVENSDTVIVVVPLFVNSHDKADFAALDLATAEIARGLKKGTLVVYETTLPIGTTRSRFAKMLEQGSGLEVGQDFHVAFSPERVLTGRVFSDLSKYPKIVGGVSQKCSLRAYSFYNSVIEFEKRENLHRENGVWVLDSSEAAEFVKLAETIYRDVNIGLVNQFATYAEEIGINVHEVIAAANSQSYAHLHQPGIAVGGHCIPVYPKLYLMNDSDAQLLIEARRINSQMPEHVIKAVEKYFGTVSGLRILILGLSYRSGVKETYGSGSLTLLKNLKEKSAEVFGLDPLYLGHEVEALGFKDWFIEPEPIDAIIVQNSDDYFKEFLKTESLDQVPIFDGRRLFLEKEDFNVVYQLGNPSI